MLEVSKHTSKSDCWMVIDNKVYDVTKFLVEHPGGEDIMLDSAGRDATREFEDVGHSGDARQQLAKLQIGVLREETEEEKKELQELQKQGKAAIASGGGKKSSILETALKILFPVLIVVLAVIVRNYVQ